MRHSLISANGSFPDRWNGRYEKDLPDKLDLPMRAGLLKNELKVLPRAVESDAELLRGCRQRDAGSEKVRQPCLTRHQSV